MLRYTKETKFKRGDRVKSVLNWDSSLYKKGDVVEGIVSEIYDASTSVFPGPERPLYQILIDKKNGKPHEDEMQCGESYIEEV